MTTLLILIALVGIVSAGILSHQVIFKRNSAGKRRLDKPGIGYLIVSTLLIIFILLQDNLQERRQKTKDKIAKSEQDKRDIKMSQVYSESQNKIISELAKELGKYKLAYDKSNNRIYALLRDSVKRPVTIINGADPIVTILNNQDMGAIKLQSEDNEWVKYVLTAAVSENGASGFNIKANIVGQDSLYKFHYLAANRVLDYKIRIPKNGMGRFYVDAPKDKYIMILFWIKGTYKNTDLTKTFKIDEVYFYNKNTGSSGLEAGATRKEVIKTVIKRIK